MKLGALYWDTEYLTMWVVINIRERYENNFGYTLFNINTNDSDPAWDDEFIKRYLTEMWMPE